MSKGKISRTSIPTSQWNSTRNQVSNLSRINQNLRGAISSANRQRSQDRTRYQNQLKQREASFTQSVNGLRSGMRKMEQRQAAAMSRQNKSFNQKLRKQSIRFNEKVLKEKNDRIKAMRKQKKELEQFATNLTIQERRERERQIRMVQNQIQELEHELKTDIARVERELNTKIDRVRLETQKAITNLRDWTTESLQNQRQEYLEISKEQQKEINEIRTDIANIFAKEQMNKETAQTFIEDLEKQINHANQNIPHQKYAPGELDKVRSRLQMSKSHLASREQSAISGAQEAYFELVDLREKVAHKEQEFMIWHSATLEAARSLFEVVRSNRQHELSEGAGTVELDYWTNGEYSKLEQEVENIKNNLENNADDLSLEQVQEHLEKLRRLEEKHSGMLKEGIEKVVSSQTRAEMGDIILEKLEDEGFRVVNRGYEQQDQRKIYVVKVINAVGSEVVISIVPDERTNANTVSINTKDDRFYSEAVTQERAREINRILKEAGIDIDGTDCHDVDVSELYDVDSILNKEGEGISKSALKAAKLLKKKT